VTTKADSKFKIVGAASVAAKVTRDVCVESWTFEELSDKDDSMTDTRKNWSREFGSGYPSGLLHYINTPIPAERDCRSKDSKLDKDLTRPHFWIPIISPLFVDHCESYIGEIRAFCEVVTILLYPSIPRYRTPCPLVQDRRRTGIINKGIRGRKGEGERSVHCHQRPWHSEHWNVVKSPC